MGKKARRVPTLGLLGRGLGSLVSPGSWGGGGEAVICERGYSLGAGQHWLALADVAANALQPVCACSVAILTVRGAWLSGRRSGGADY